MRCWSSASSRPLLISVMNCGSRRIEIKEIGFGVGPAAVGAPAAAAERLRFSIGGLEKPLFIRSRRPGIPSVHWVWGQSKAEKYLIDKKIPRQQRGIASGG